MNIQYIHPADQIVMFMQRVYDKKLTSMSGGNLSVRDNEGNIWITPASIDKGSLIRIWTMSQLSLIMLIRFFLLKTNRSW